MLFGVPKNQSVNSMPLIVRNCSLQRPPDPSADFTVWRNLKTRNLMLMEVRHLGWHRLGMIWRHLKSSDFYGKVSFVLNLTSLSWLRCHVWNKIMPNRVLFNTRFGKSKFNTQLGLPSKSTPKLAYSTHNYTQPFHSSTNHNFFKKACILCLSILV